ncbi:MAG TPA: Crp/Fnr family transcriptional regulator [Bacillota bacterium]
MTEAREAGQALSAAAARELLRSLPLLHDLPDADLDPIARLLRMRRVAAGSFVFFQGDPGEAVWFLVSGRVRIVKTAPDGTQRTLHICEPGDVFGAVVLFDRGEYPASAEALADSVVAYLRREDFDRVAAQLPQLSGALVGVLGTRLRRAHQRLLEFTATDTEGRLAELLLQLADAKTFTIQQPPTHQELATYIGSARETVSRILSRWRRLGWIETQGRRLLIRNPEALKAAGGER